MKNIIGHLIFYTILPLIYLLKLIAIFLSLFGVGECNCEDMETEKFYFTEKIFGASIAMIVLTLIVASL